MTVGSLLSTAPRKCHRSRSLNPSCSQSSLHGWLSDIDIWCVMPSIRWWHPALHIDLSVTSHSWLCKCSHRVAVRKRTAESWKTEVLVTSTWQEVTDFNTCSIAGLFTWLIMSWSSTLKRAWLWPAAWCSTNMQQAFCRHATTQLCSMSYQSFHQHCQYTSTLHHCCAPGLLQHPANWRDREFEPSTSCSELALHV